jgi:hypothetical protein
VRTSVVSMFANALDAEHPKSAWLDAIIRAIASGRYQTFVEACHAARAEAESSARNQGLAPEAVAKAGKVAFQNAKKMLPAFTPAGTFSQRNAASLQRYSQVVPQDVDNIGLQEALALRDHLRSDPHVVFCYVSPSGKGVKIGVRVDSPPERHRQAFEAAARYLREQHGVNPAAQDSKNSDLSRLAFVSADPGAWFNPDAQPLHVPEADSAMSAATPPLNAYAPVDEGRIRAALKFIPAMDREVWLKVGIALKSGLGEAGCALFDEWSRTAPDAYDAGENAKQWRSFKPGGGVTIATLFFLAQQNGWKPRPERFRSGSAADEYLGGMPAIPTGEDGETGELPALPPVDWAAISSNSSNPSAGYAFENQAAVLPAKSFLERYMDYTRLVYESPDAYLLGGFLPIMAAAMQRNVRIRWADGWLYPNVYNLLVGPQSNGKSDALSLPETLARHVLGHHRMLSTMMSAHSLVDCYVDCPDRLLLVDDGNQLLTLWGQPGHGELFGSMFLRLYDGKSVSDDFRRNKKSTEEDDGASTARFVPETSTSLIIGVTYNRCRFDGISARNGLGRRFLYYVADNLERFIVVPMGQDSTVLRELRERLHALTTLRLELSLPSSGEFFEVWRAYQMANRQRLAAETDELAKGRVRTAPTHVLKIAMIFEAALWAEDQRTLPAQLSVAALQTAMQHVDEHLRMCAKLDRYAQRKAIEEQADRLIEQIRVQYRKYQWPSRAGTIYLARTDLTATFAHNSQRFGSLSTDDLYLRLIPRLVERNEARLVKKEGKRELYAFRLQPPAEEERRWIPPAPAPQHVPATAADAPPAAAAEMRSESPPAGTAEPTVVTSQEGSDLLVV